MHVIIIKNDNNKKFKISFTNHKHDKVSRKLNINRTNRICMTFKYLDTL